MPTHTRLVTSFFPCAATAPRYQEDYVLSLIQLESMDAAALRTRLLVAGALLLTGVAAAFAWTQWKQSSNLRSA